MQVVTDTITTVDIDRNLFAIVAAETKGQADAAIEHARGESQSTWLNASARGITLGQMVLVAVITDGVQHSGKQGLLF